MVGFRDQDDWASATHAALGVYANLPQGLDGVLKIHDLDAGQLGGDDLFGRSDNLSGILCGGFLGFAGLDDLVQASLVGGGKLFLGDLFVIAFDQLGCILHSVGRETMRTSLSYPSPMPGP